MSGELIGRWFADKAPIAAALLIRQKTDRHKGRVAPAPERRSCRRR
jgi:hypothetical protein